MTATEELKEYLCSISSQVKRQDLINILTFIEQGADPNIYDNDGRTILHFAATIPDGIDFMPLFFTLGANLDSITKSYETPIMIATSSNMLINVKSLFNLGANLHYTNGDGYNLLHYTAENNNIEMLDYFWENRVKYQLDTHSHTISPLGMAIILGSNNIVERLIKYYKIKALEEENILELLYNLRETSQTNDVLKAKFLAIETCILEDKDFITDSQSIKPLIDSLIEDNVQKFSYFLKFYRSNISDLIFSDIGNIYDFAKKENSENICKYLVSKLGFIGEYEEEIVITEEAIEITNNFTNYSDIDIS